MNSKNRSLVAIVAASGLCLTAAASALAGPTPKASPAPKKAAAATQYECSKCHMRVSAAVAKKDGYNDPMDGGRFLPVKPAATKPLPHGKGI